MKKIIDVSVIILNYNTLELTRKCLLSLLDSKLGAFSMEVIVCDNASSDGSQEMVTHEFPKVRFIQNGKNVGFAAGNNPGIRVAKGRYILLLNSDTEVSKDTIATMVRFMDSHPDAGASTCKLVLADGSMDPACHRGFPTPWVAFTYLSKLASIFPKSRIFGEYHQGYKNFNATHTVDCISGAFFLIPRTIINDVGALDEDYFMYAEDIDWSYRIRKKGWNIWYVPETVTLHKKKQSGRSNVLKKRRVTTEIYFHTYNWLFFKKHYARTYGPVLSGIVNSVYSLRLLLLKHFSL